MKREHSKFLAVEASQYIGIGDRVVIPYSFRPSCLYRPITQATTVTCRVTSRPPISILTQRRESDTSFLIRSSRKSSLVLSWEPSSHRGFNVHFSRPRRHRPLAQNRKFNESNARACICAREKRRRLRLWAELRSLYVSRSPFMMQSPPIKRRRMFLSL